MWTNIHDESIKSGIITSPISDHLPVFVCLNCDSQPESPTPNLTRCFSSTNINKFNSLLENIDISLILNEIFPNSAFELLMESYFQAFSQSFPLKAFPPNNIKFNKPRYDDDLHQRMLNKDKLFRKFICKKSPSLKAKYDMTRNIYFYTLRTKKSNYYALLFEKNKFNLKATWKTINKLLGKGKVASCSSLVVDNQWTSDPLAIANYFNNHFASIVSKLVDNLPPSLHNFKEHLGTSSAQCRN